MNLFLHGVEDFPIERGDTLRNPVFSDPSTRRLATLRLRDRQSAVLAGGVGREICGKATRGDAHFAGLPTAQVRRLCLGAAHGQSMAPRTGRMAVVLPQGALFRVAAEGKIRRKTPRVDLSRPSSAWRRTSSMAPDSPPASWCSGTSRTSDAARSCSWTARTCSAGAATRTPSSPSTSSESRLVPALRRRPGSSRRS